MLHLSSLVTGPFGMPEELFVQYDVWVTALGDENGTALGGVRTVTGDADHRAVVDFDSLAASASYTAWVHGTWMATGGWGEVQAYELQTSVHFTLKPCPAKPVTPAGLAATGVDDP